MCLQSRSYNEAKLNVTPCNDALLISLSSQFGLAEGREGDGVAYPGTAILSYLRADANKPCRGRRKYSLKA